MRLLSVAALVLVLAAPAHAAPFGKPRTLGTTPSEYEYDFMSSEAGPGGGAAFFVAGEKQVGLKLHQRLFIARVEGNGRTHRLTSTRVNGRTPTRSYDGGPPGVDLAVGPGWRMLTTEVRPGKVTGINDIYAVRLAPDGRRAATQRLGPSYKASGIFRTNARGDAIAEYGEGFTIARSAGRFVRAPKALREYDGLPRLAADGSLYDLRRPDDTGSLAVAYSRGRRWSRPQSIFAAAPGQAVYYDDLVSSPNGDALLVYGIGTSIERTNLLARWSRDGRPFGPPVELTSSVDPFSVGIQAIPGGRFAVRWVDSDRDLHLLRASGFGRPFREVLTWAVPGPVRFRAALPLPDGRTLLGWTTDDPNGAAPDRLMAAVADDQGRIGPAQTIAAARENLYLGGFSLRRLAGNRAALVWGEGSRGKKRWRIVLARR